MKTITIDGIEYQLTPVTTEASKPMQWQPKGRIYEIYYYFDNKGVLRSTRHTGQNVDEQFLSFGNYFTTETEAKKATTQVRQLLRLRAYVREFAPDYKPDWANDSEQKWYIHFDEQAKNWCYGNNQFMCNITTVYMPECVAKELVKKLNSGEMVL